MTQFVEVQAPDSDARGKVPARSLRRWIEKGFKPVDEAEAEKVLADYPDPNAPAPTGEVIDVQPVPPEGDGSQGASEVDAVDGAGESAEGSDTPTVGDDDAPDPDPGTAADSADTPTTTSGRRRGGAAASNAR